MKETRSGGGANALGARRHRLGAQHLRHTPRQAVRPMRGGFPTSEKDGEAVVGRRAQRETVGPADKRPPRLPASPAAPHKRACLRAGHGSPAATDQHACALVARPPARPAACSLCSLPSAACSGAHAFRGGGSAEPPRHAGARTRSPAAAHRPATPARARGLRQPPPVSTGERPLFDILQDRRFWVVHVVALPALFAAGAAFVAGAAQAPALPGYAILTDRFGLA